ncbi:MAG: hypothetical protein ACR2MT_11530 [Aurantibacter sp.]
MKGKKSYIILSIALLLIVVSIATYNYMYKEHRNIATEDISFDVSASELKTDLSSPDKALKYIDKVVQVQGKVSAVEENAVVIDDKVQVSFIENVSNSLSVQKQITIKGRCVGYDDLLELVKIDQATLIHDD